MPHDTPLSTLDRYGPDSTATPPSREEALAYVRGLATGHYENFSVLSRLVPAGVRDDFSAVYAFCRWADDLGDETGADEAARERSLELLGWWRSELESCFARVHGDDDAPLRHPVFIALAETVQKHGLPIAPFSDLISAFEQDQHTRRYDTWEQLIGYCKLSANPVGNLVLRLAGERPECEGGRAGSDEMFRLSDTVCSALQLINFWQDVRRDLDERDRVYLPAVDTGVGADQLRDWARRPMDPEARVPYIKAVRPLVTRTRAMFDEGEPLPGMLTDKRFRPVVWLFRAGGLSVLRSVERIGCATLWERPRLTKPQKGALVLRAWVGSRLVGVSS